MENIIYGIQPVLEALKTERRVLQRILLFEAHPSAPLRHIRELAAAKGIPVQGQLRDTLTQMVKNEHHQGVVGILADSLYASWEELLRGIRIKERWTRVLVLDGLEDPQNFGSLIRTAEACGAAGIIIPKDRAVGLTPAAIKSSAGAFVHIPIVRVTNLASSLEELKQEGFWIIGADARGEKNLYDMRFDMNVGIVIGSEGKGIRPRVLSKCDFTVSIPMLGKVSSLNAAISGALILFEIFRQHAARQVP